MGARLCKTDELGYFEFGGSDIVMIFQDRSVAIEAEVGTKYLQGLRIGRRGKHHCSSLRAAGDPGGVLRIGDRETGPEGP